jgi:prepilin-type N-terminal cleavage/methylation domain-containing protein
MTTPGRRAHSGFSLIELLVTVVMAGLIFAAMAPMYILAQSKNGADNARTIALQVAQDKIEKIRQLDYDQIAADSANRSTIPNLYNSSFAGSQFGPTFVADSGTTTKTFTIDYTVSAMPTGSAPGAEQYKKVVVDVYWTGAPRPVKHVLLQTFIYRQYAGPQITALAVSPVNTSSEPDTIVASAVTITATISDNDIASMNASGTPKGFVRFMVNQLNGTQVVYDDVENPVSLSTPGIYRDAWDASSAPDGIYTFQAVAYSQSQFEGNTVSVAYRIERGAPAAPIDLAASPADGSVTLTWAASLAGDLDHYEVWRGTSAASLTRIASSVTVNDYADGGLTNGTTYYYAVKAVDTLGNASSPSTTVSANPSVQSDTVAPTVPGSFAAAKSGASQPSIKLTWTASTDSGTPTSGLGNYEIQRSANGSSGWTTVEANSPSTAVTYTDAAAGYSSTWYYRMRAKDVAGNYSAYTSVVSATTDAIPKYTLTVQNNDTSTSVYVRVQDVSTGLYYTTSGVSQASPPAEVEIRKKGKTATWSNLPAAMYNVFGRYGSTTTKLADLTGGARTVAFP